MPKKTTKKTKVPGEAKLTSANQEVFCRLYAGRNSEYFGNAKRSYMLAYNKQEEIREMKEKMRKEKDESEKIKLQKEIRRSEVTIEVCASQLLRRPKVSKRVDYLLDQMLENVNVDRELAFVISQRKDLQAKVRAISEFNKVKKRVEDKGVLTGTVTFQWDDSETKNN